MRLAVYHLINDNTQCWLSPFTSNNQVSCHTFAHSWVPIGSVLKVSRIFIGTTRRRDNIPCTVSLFCWFSKKTAITNKYPSKNWNGIVSFISKTEKYQSPNIQPNVRTTIDNTFSSADNFCHLEFDDNLYSPQFRFCFIMLQRSRFMSQIFSHSGLEGDNTLWLWCLSICFKDTKEFSRHQTLFWLSYFQFFPHLCLISAFRSEISDPVPNSKHRNYSGYKNDFCRLNLTRFNTRNWKPFS